MEDLGERARWLSAVLIVVSIIAVGAIVRLWPSVSLVRSAETVALASRPLYLLDAPVVVADVPPAFDAPAPAMSLARVVSPADEPHPVSADAIIQIQQPETREAAHVEPVTLAPLPLSSRALDIPRVEPVAVAQGRPVVLTEDSQANSFVEVPAVVVSRALGVAGRGILTGVRATGALVRLAF